MAQEMFALNDLTAFLTMIVCCSFKKPDPVEGGAPAMGPDGEVSLEDNNLWCTVCAPSVLLCLLTPSSAFLFPTSH